MYVSGSKSNHDFFIFETKEKKVPSRRILFQQYLDSFVFASYFSGGSNSKQIRGWQKRACTMYIHSRLAQNIASRSIANYQGMIIGWNFVLPT